MNKEFWKNKRVFITGHTGFKGSWLTIWLHILGAKVYGYALKPPTDPSLYDRANVSELVASVIRDIRDLSALKKTINEVMPEIVIHMAAQPIVRESYKIPVETYEVNVMGTVNILEAVRSCDSVRAFLNVTTDKVYDNKEWVWGYRESEPLGGFDPYSNSKACSELVTTAYRNSYFNCDTYNQHRVGIASARAGNVIGGGDWALDRIVPDCIKSIIESSEIVIRNPNAVRPWQHVLEPLSGYLCLIEKLFDRGIAFSSGWNFGPNESDCVSVNELVRKLCRFWGEGAMFRILGDNGPHEANFLKLDCSKAHHILGWTPKWNLDEAVQKIVTWTKKFCKGDDVRDLCVRQIIEYMEPNKI